MPRARKKKLTPADPRALPVIRGRIPDYTALVRANRRFRQAYAAELDRRRAERMAHLRDRARKGDVRAFAVHAAAIRRRLVQSLGGFAPAGPPPEARLTRTVPVTGGGRGLCGPLPRRSSGRIVLRRFELPGWAASGEDLGLVEVRNGGGSPRPLALVLGDAGRELSGGESPETIASRWGYALADAGYVVAIPDAPAARRISNTRNKALLLAGSCVLGELVDDADRALTAALRRPGIDPRRVWVLGSGLGGLVALVLTALDRRVAGCVSADAPRSGDLDLHEALTVPAIDALTDLAELLAATAPAPLALLEAGVCPWGEPHGSLGWADAPARAARRAARAPAGSYTRMAAPGYRARALARLLAWMSRTRAGPRSTDRRPAALPRRARKDAVVSISACGTRAAWTRKRQALRRQFRRLLGIPARHRVHRVDFIARDRLRDCTREEFDVWSSEHTGAKVVLLHPKKPRAARGPNPTVLCIPGSSSHAGRVEEQYAHEVVARGWTAAIVDCRVAVYPFHPGIRAGRVIIGQSVHDQLCVVDFLAGHDAIDASRIGSMGVSQGGAHTWMLAALDERIAAAAPVCGVLTYRSLIEDVRDEHSDGAGISFLDSHSIYYYVPGILRCAEQAELMGLIAPRPLAILGAIHDNCCPERGVREIGRALRKLYRLHGAGRNFSFFMLDGPHSMPPLLREKAYRFLEKHL